MKAYKYTIFALTITVLLNLVFTASIVSLIGGIIVLFLVWGLRKGEYSLAKPLSGLLILLALVNLVGLFTAAFALITGSAPVSILSLIWLLVYTAALVLFSLLLRSQKIRDYLATAPQPEEKKKKIQFFHGGWRDL